MPSVLLVGGRAGTAINLGFGGRRSPTTEPIRPHTSNEEMRRIAEFRDARILDELWLKADRSGAVIVLEAKDAEDTQRHLATLPLVAHGIATFEVTELVPADSARSLTPA